ncbi:MAG: response regulator [Clostridia bacterium]|nr:response regulator [Clostridia bacterium]MBN2883004.1 response regulator [Clostridia bacterium]
MKTILVIDDEKNIRRSVSMYLSGHEYIVIESDEGLKGISMAKDRKPDLILLDLILPDMDGYLVCRALRENPETEEIPIVVFSARCRKEDIEKARECGALDYITKPFEPSALLGTIKKYI